MLTLTRKSGESIRIGDDIRLVIREVRGRGVRVGIEAPGDVQIHREEVYLRIQDENAAAAQAGAPYPNGLAALVEDVGAVQSGAGSNGAPKRAYASTHYHGGQNGNGGNGHNQPFDHQAYVDGIITPGK